MNDWQYIQEEVRQVVCSCPDLSGREVAVFLIPWESSEICHQGWLDDQFLAPDLGICLWGCEVGGLRSQTYKKLPPRKSLKLWQGLAPLLEAFASHNNGGVPIWRCSRRHALGWQRILSAIGRRCVYLRGSLAEGSKVLDLGGEFSDEHIIAMVGK